MDSLAEAAEIAAAMMDELSKIVDNLATAPETGAYGALPPEVNSARLNSGPGPVPLTGTAAAYTAIADALAAAAGGSDGSTNTLEPAWDSPAGTKAKGAFRKHAMWLREQSVVATQTAALAAQAAAVNTAARGAMPPLELIVANRLSFAILSATNEMGQNTPAIAANEAMYYGMWMEAAYTMYAYEAASEGLVASLPPSPEAPPIAGGGGDSTVPVYDTGPGSGRQGVDFDSKPQYDGGGPDSGGSGPDSGGKSDPGGGPDNGGGDTGGGSDKPGPSDPTGPQGDAMTPDEGTTSLADGITDPGMDPGFGENYLGEDRTGFYGTSPYSTTLAGLSGGAGSLVGLGMLNGGLGSMSGGSTGFRMPTNWNPGAVKAFGPLPTQAAPAPMARQTPPRGAVAPQARMRRRRDDDERPSKVFVPGEHEEVPVLERPPIIGVIEYADNDREEFDYVDQPVLVGVIENIDDEPVPATAERPR
ncbi:PPE family protein [Nocardia wallacei]|uniref:PPE family protein n=1 Tax=Nocardia wallacei TaxID=480035 RepID=UPI0024541FA6|nr:PPE family protein [Nocardia wallacei]